jgi:uncharacterized protein YjaG (DUF416 family)
MDNLKIFQGQIDRQLQRTTDSERIRFGLDICNRLLPDYKAFEIKDKWGDSSVLIEAIKFIDTFINKESIDLGKLDLLISMIDKVIPDTEDFSDWDVSFALNASVSIFELLSYLKDKDYNHILTISTLMTDNIDFKIQMNNTKITDDEIDCHPMLTAEFKHQLELIK